MEKKTVYILLGLILLLGLFLRVYQLDHKSLWMDEAFSVHHAGLYDLGSLNYNVAMTEAAPMGYYVLLHYWMGLFGNSVVAIRLLSVLFGVLSVGLLYLLVRLFFDVQVGLLASFFMAISMEQVLFSQEARIYSLFTFLTLLMVYFFARWFLLLEKESQKKDVKKEWGYFCAYIFTLLIALYVNYLALLFIFIFSCLLFWRIGWRREVAFKWIVGHLLLLLMAIPVFVMARVQFGIINVNLSTTLATKQLPSLLAKLGLFFYVVPILVLILLVGLLFVNRKMFEKIFFGQEFDWLFLLGLFSFSLVYLYLCFFPLRLFGIPVFRVPITNSYFLIRHSLFLAPILYVYVSYRIVHLRSFVAKRMGIIFLVLISVVALVVYFETSTKSQWKETAQLVHLNGGDRPSVLLDRAGISNEFLWRYYYPWDFDLIRLTWGEGRWSLGQLNETQLNLMLAGKKDFFVVFSKNEKTAAFYKNYFDSHYTLDLENDFYQIKVYHYTGNSTIS